MHYSFLGVRLQNAEINPYHQLSQSYHSHGFLHYWENSNLSYFNWSWSDTLKHSQLKCDCSLHAGYLLGFLFDPEDGSNLFFWEAGWLSLDYTALYHRRQSNLKWINIFCSLAVAFMSSYLAEFVFSVLIVSALNIQRPV